MAHMGYETDSEGRLEFERLVTQYYRPMYKFAFSLVRSEADACDLTQQTFYVWAKRGHQLRDESKVKSWLFTTLHREFLRTRRRQTRFPHEQFDEAAPELPTTAPTTVNQLDSAAAVDALGRLDELHRAPLALFYLEECSYKEIAEILEVPIGTVQSRIARGKAQLQQIVAGLSAPAEFGEQRG
jgi:RNA polymerase sigma factor (sigma-70 family)